MKFNNSSVAADKMDTMIQCQRCSVKIVSGCQQCGCGNMPEDKYCGGCGPNLNDQNLPEQQASKMNISSAASGKYSSDDISAFFRGKDS